LRVRGNLSERATVRALASLSLVNNAMVMA
jgi:hypothetical protein